MKTGILMITLTFSLSAFGTTGTKPTENRTVAGIETKIEKVKKESGWAKKLRSGLTTNGGFARF